MNTLRPALATVVLAGLCSAVPTRAHAAESYDNCTGFIDSLPAVITTQGTWCLRKDLSTAMASGVAIGIATNNVTIDCNDFKIGGLAAGPESLAQGITASGRQNIKVRDCNIRGFLNGIRLVGGSGHIVEDNRIDSSLFMGISLAGEGGLVRSNQVTGTGGTPLQNGSSGIEATADIIDNTVDGVFAVGTDTFPTGILAGLDGSEVRNNRVRALVVNGNGFAQGYRGSGKGITWSDNRVSSVEPVQGWGLIGGEWSFCTGNTVGRYSTAFLQCQDAGGNASN